MTCLSLQRCELSGEPAARFYEGVDGDLRAHSWLGINGIGPGDRVVVRSDLRLSWCLFLSTDQGRRFVGYVKSMPELRRVFRKGHVWAKSFRHLLTYLHKNIRSPKGEALCGVQSCEDDHIPSFGDPAASNAMRPVTFLFRSSAARNLHY